MGKERLAARIRRREIKDRRHLDRLSPACTDRSRAAGVGAYVKE